MFFSKQSPCLAQREINNDEIVFSTHISGVRKYSSLPTKESYARFIMEDADGSGYCNELLFSNCHSYVDLDSPSTLQQLGWASEPEFMAAFENLLKVAFAKHLGVTLNDCFLWSSSTRPGKTSYHLKIDCGHYWTAAQRKTDMKSFFKLVNSEMLNNEGFHFLEQDGDRIQITSILDLSVYSANRCLRSIHCMKPNSQVRFRPIDQPPSHAAIMHHMLTVTPAEKLNMTPFSLKSRCQIPKQNISVNTKVFESLAARYNSAYVKTQGSLIILRNTGPRLCPIGGETNTEDNAYMVLKDRGRTVHIGCHNECCKGEILQIHEFTGEREYEFYQDYQKLLKKPAVVRTDIENYLLGTVKYVDRQSEPFFVTLSKVGLSSFDHQLNVSQASCSKTLFQRYSDIKLLVETEDEPETIKFSKVLSSMMERRKIPTYDNAVWLPFMGTCPPLHGCLNLFQGFALEQVPEEAIDFEKTQIYDLLCKLVGNKQEHLKYLKNFIAAKIQKPYIKHPICLCFVNSREGAGKGSFALFLEKLFSCGENTLVSYNSLTSFASSFNGIQSKALWIILDEVSAKRGGLREYNGLLKDKISSTTLLCEIKNQERVQQPWYANLCIFSNDFNVVQCSHNDRRLVFFTSDSSKANDKNYFVALYKELNDLKIMRAAFSYFRNMDTGDFNYRAIPYSRIKDQLADVSEKNATKFHRHLLKMWSGQELYHFSAAELYSYYRDFVEEFGIAKPVNRSSCVANFALHLNPTRNGDDFTLTEAKRLKFLER